MPHIHEKYDFTIGVYIVFEDTVLLVNHPRYHKWIPIGGHVELDEDPEEALFREIAEETGLEVRLLGTKPLISSPGTKSLLTPAYLDVHEANIPHKHINLVYFGQATTNQAILSDEHTELKWFSVPELQKSQYHLEPIVVFYAQEAIERATHA